MKTKTNMKHIALTFLAAFLLPVAISAADGDIKKTTVDGIEWTYTVLSETSKTCLIGGEEKVVSEFGYTETKTTLAIDENTAGNIVIPASLDGYAVVAIGEAAFDDCKKIQSVYVPVGVSYIGKNAFSSCENLTHVALPEGLTHIGEEAFNSCAFFSIVLPESLIRIGEQAFEDTKLTSITLPKNVAYLGNEDKVNEVTGDVEEEDDLYGDVFSGCNWLTEVNVSEENMAYASVNGMLLTKDKKTLLFFPQANPFEAVPEGVETIYASAFHEAKLTSVTLPKSLQAIDAFAFENCENLTSVISKIEEPFAIEENVFYLNGHDSRFTTATLYVPVDTKAKYEATEGWRMFKNIVEQNAMIIESTCAGIIEGEDGTYYRVTGTCVTDPDNRFGNWYLEDETGRIYIYGTNDKNGDKGTYPVSGANGWGFGIGDLITVEGPKTTYNGITELVDVTVRKVEKALVRIEDQTKDLVDTEGGEFQVRLSVTGEDPTVNFDEETKSWISVSEIKKDATTVRIRFKVAANDGKYPRTGIIRFSSSSGSRTSTVSTTISQMGQSGTLANPFTVEEAITYSQTLTGDGTIDVYVKGIVSKVLYKFYAAQYGTGRFYISDNGGYNGQNYQADPTRDLLVYDCSYLGNQIWTEENANISYHDEVVICGKLTIYNGVCRTQFNDAYVYSINHSTTDANGLGSYYYPFNKAGAFNYADNGGTKYVYVKGVVSEVADGGQLGTQNDKVHFWINDDGMRRDDDLEICDIFWINGDIQWTEINVGDKVVIDGVLMKEGSGYKTVPNCAYVHSCNGRTSYGVHVSITADYFPDDYLRNYVSTHYDLNKDGYLDDDEIAAVKEFPKTGVSWSYGKGYGCSDFTGIEYLTTIEHFWASSYGATKLDLSKNKELTWIQFTGNELVSIDISGCSKLETLKLYYGRSSSPPDDEERFPLAAIDVSNNPALKLLSCGQAQLTSLDISHNLALQELSIPYNRLNTLDVSNNPAITSLYCANNMLTTLNVSNPTLERLDCNGNQLTSLDVSNNPTLKYLNCARNPLTALDVSENPELETLYCGGGQMTTLDVSNNTKLMILGISDTPMATLDISNNAALTSLFVNDNQLKAVDLSNNTALTTLRIGNNKITTLDVSNNSALIGLHISNNRLPMLDLSHNTALESLNCSGNLLTTLDVSYNVALTWLDVSHNQLIAIDVSNNAALTSLNVSNNQLSMLNVSKNMALEWLQCSDNQLSTLDVSNNPELRILICANNHLFALDLSQCPSLRLVHCFGNRFRGKAMDKLIDDLPATSDQHWIMVVDANNDHETNVCTKAQVAAAKEKGWTVTTWPEGYAYDGSAYYGNEYEGSDPTDLVLDKDNFADDQFRNALAAVLGLSEGETITEEMIEELAELNVSNLAIENLLGIEHFTALRKLFCQSNRIKGDAMDALIYALPTVAAEAKGVGATSAAALYVLDFTDAAEGNVCTTAQVADACAKGWNVYCFDENGWREYAGSETSGIQTVATPMPTTVRIRTLDGKVLNNLPTRKGIYVVNGKKVILK